MNSRQKINHFPGAWALGSKARLWRHVNRQKEKLGPDFELCPPTYIFPGDYESWMQERERNGFSDLYILKPTESCCGRGIKVIGKKDRLKKTKRYLVQKYID